MKFYDKVFEIENRGKRRNDLEAEILKVIKMFKEEYNNDINIINTSIREMRNIIIQQDVLIKELLKNGIKTSINYTSDEQQNKNFETNMYVPKPDTENIKSRKKTKSKIVDV